MDVAFGDMLISTDSSRLDQDRIYELLSTTYWAGHRPMNKVRKSIEHSLCYGVYQGDRQIGFARVITDWTTTYWLCDVVIDADFRGQGIGKKLIDTIVRSDDLQGLSGFLGTADAHGLYEQYGFVKDANRFMVRRPSS